jgi:hypothetical protein
MFDLIRPAMNGYVVGQRRLPHRLSLGIAIFVSDPAADVRDQSPFEAAPQAFFELGDLRAGSRCSAQSVSARRAALNV